jgi:hypothetical protein
MNAGNFFCAAVIPVAFLAGAFFADVFFSILSCIAIVFSFYSIYFFELFLFEMPAAFFLASAFELAPQAFNDNNNLVGLPFLSFSGPGIPPILAKKDARLGLSPAFTGALRFIPCFFAEALPVAFSPPLGFLPAFVCHAGDFAIIYFLFMIQVASNYEA